MSKTVLITGASRGIGRETALEFARAGYSVAVNFNRSAQAADELVAQLTSLGCDAAAFRCDVADYQQVFELVDTVNERFGRIDVLVNNAGIAQQRMFCDITPENWARMFQVNVTGVYNACQAVLPQMIRRHSGRIINLSSIWGISGASCEVHYSASKAAVIGLTKALAKEVGPSGITVNCVAPGVIATEMNSQHSQADLDALCEETPLGTIGTTGDVAGIIVFLAGEKAGFLTGQVISPNGGIVM